jgi:ribose transport system permease protein
MSTVAPITSPDPIADPDGGAVPAAKSQRRFLQFMARYGTILGMLLMVVIFSITMPESFPTFTNLRNVVNQAALAAIIAGGLTVALIVGEMDLSIGFHGSLAGVLVTGFLVRAGLPLWVAIPAVLAIGVLIGIVNGLIVTKARVNAVIGTLGVGTVLTGLTFAYTAGSPISSGVPSSFTAISLGQTFSIPNNILIMAVVMGLLWTVINRTDIGQHFEAVGGNTEAARLSGIAVDRVKIIAFAIAGVCAALTGILLASLLGSGTSSAADSYLLDAFAATFLGSATLRNGEFHIVGTLIGVLFIALGFNGLALLGAATFWQYLFKGSVLVAAVALSTVARRLAHA